MHLIPAVQPPEEQIAQLAAWYRGEAGRALLALEQRLLQPRLAACFGYNLLQIGLDGELDLMSDCRIQRRLFAGPVRVASGAGSPVYCAFEALPFDSDSIDAVVVHHALECAANPHALLRELQRVLVPRGRLFVLGFNPWSLHGLRVLSGRLRQRGPWRHGLIAAHRVCDWMKLLDFAHEPIVYGYHRPWLKAAEQARAGTDARPAARYWPGGSIYLIEAVLQIARLTPLRPRWRERRGLAPVLPPAIKPGPAAIHHRFDHRFPGNDDH